MKEAQGFCETHELEQGVVEAQVENRPGVSTVDECGCRELTENGGLANAAGPGKKERSFQLFR